MCTFQYSDKYLKGNVTSADQWRIAWIVTKWLAIEECIIKYLNWLFPI